MSRSKGERREREARDVLREMGFRVEKCKNHRFGDNDYFNLFDLMAVHAFEKIKYVQVKSNATDGALKEIDGEAIDFPLRHCDLEVWICYDAEGWRVLRLRPDKGEAYSYTWKEVVDGRDHNGNMGEAVIQHYG